MDLKNKNAVITGANSGIGKAIATILAQQGVNVVISGRRQELNKSVAEHLQTEFKIQAIPIQSDVSKEQDCIDLIKKSSEALGSIDIFVNNAGIFDSSPIEETSTQSFDSVLKTNLYGAFWCAREVFKKMKENTSKTKGYLINISSVAGVQSWESLESYSTSKFGLQGLNYSLWEEGKKLPIKVTSICPALVATPMTEVSGEAYLQPEDIAETVLYLLKLSTACWPREIVLYRRDAEV